MLAKSIRTCRITLTEAETQRWVDLGEVPEAQVTRAAIAAALQGLARCSIYTTRGNLAVSVPAAQARVLKKPC